MSNLSMVEARLPPGFRFHPRDVELICDYLMKKVMRCDLQPPLLVEVDLNKSEPWDIPESACVGRREWYFYSQRDRKYATGLRTNRATISGYWKATGKDRPVLRKGALVGMRKTLVFYQGRAPKGKKTDWVMHEFRLEGPFLPPKLSSSSSKEDWVLCRVFYKNREGPIKQSVGMGSTSMYDHDTLSCSSTLPPLTEPYSNHNFTAVEQHTPHSQTQVMSNQNIINDEHCYEQVPCFSIFTPNQTLSHIITTTSSSCQTHMVSNPLYHNNANAKITSESSTFGTTAFPSSSSDVATYFDPSLSCEKRAIRAVLDQYLNKDLLDTIDPKLNGNLESSSFGDQGSTSDQSFLSDVGLPNADANSVWYPY